MDIGGAFGFLKDPESVMFTWFLSHFQKLNNTFSLSLSVCLIRIANVLLTFSNFIHLQPLLAMEALVERLEQAVIRLEAVSAKLQGCSGSMANGDINGLNGTGITRIQ